LGMRM